MKSRPTVVRFSKSNKPPSNSSKNFSTACIKVDLTTKAASKTPPRFQTPRHGPDQNRLPTERRRTTGDKFHELGRIDKALLKKIETFLDMALARQAGRYAEQRVHVADVDVDVLAHLTLTDADLDHGHGEVPGWVAAIRGIMTRELRRR